MMTRISSEANALSPSVLASFIQVGVLALAAISTLATMYAGFVATMKGQAAP